MAIPMDLARGQKVRWCEVTQEEEQAQEDLDVDGIWAALDGIV